MYEMLFIKTETIRQITILSKLKNTKQEGEKKKFLKKLKVFWNFRFSMCLGQIKIYVWFQ